MTWDHTASEMASTCPHFLPHFSLPSTKKLAICPPLLRVAGEIDVVKKVFCNLDTYIGRIIIIDFLHFRAGLNVYVTPKFL